MSNEQQKRILDPAELLAVARDIAQHLFLDRRIGGLAERDIDQAELTASRIEHPIPRIDALRDIPGERQAKNRHKGLLLKAKSRDKTMQARCRDEASRGRMSKA